MFNRDELTYIEGLYYLSSVERDSGVRAIGEWVVRQMEDQGLVDPRKGDSP